MKEKAISFIAFLARVAVGAILFYAGFIKLIAPPEEFAYAIESYKLFPSTFAQLAAIAFPWFEIYLGSFMFFGLFHKISESLSFLVFVFFELIMLQALARGLEVTNCGCFGSAGSNSIETEIALNIIWLICCVLAYKKGGDFSLDKFLDSRIKNEK